MDELGKSTRATKVNEKIPHFKVNLLCFAPAELRCPKSHAVASIMLIMQKNKTQQKNMQQQLGTDCNIRESI